MAFQSTPCLTQSATGAIVSTSWLHGHSGSGSSISSLPCGMTSGETPYSSRKLMQSLLSWKRRYVLWYQSSGVEQAHRLFASKVCFYLIRVRGLKYILGCKIVSCFCGCWTSQWGHRKMIPLPCQILKLHLLLNRYDCSVVGIANHLQQCKAWQWQRYHLVPMAMA